ncbi:NAD(P)H-dependent oxidoreductase [Microbulbifer bruguierae]|uniref:NAD(P)H-dependent oxidoreductase n=1 Tax=Microbulbifer bruguierae TaxID=3029061 RepID=A0ABY8N9B9_9GAMM|nr:NAD(P)H-dependent oxidoreductase [Microbulbifer bruguierae]WGL15019.1 NAD(P)H-dependent oxidoreductase [Microbulbifer bruguierae]
MQLLSALQWRYAVRRFTEQQLPSQVVEKLIEATRLSASSYGLQPFRIIQVDSRKVREQLLPHAMGQYKVLDCSHLLVFAAETNSDETTVNRYISQRTEACDLSLKAQMGIAKHMKSVLAKMTPYERHIWAREQVFLALGTTLTAAAVLQIDSCPMTGFAAEGFDRVLGLTERGLTATALCALGYRHPEDDQAGLPKVRIPVRDFLQVV